MIEGILHRAVGRNGVDFPLHLWRAHGQSPQKDTMKSRLCYHQLFITIVKYDKVETEGDKIIITINKKRYVVVP